MSNDRALIHFSGVEASIAAGLAFAEHRAIATVFDAWLRGQLSDDTRRSYAADLTQWRGWCAERGLNLAEAAQLGALVDYREHLRDDEYAPGRRYSAASIARKLAVVRSALDAARAAGLIASHAGHDLKSYRVSSLSPRSALDDASVRRILALPDDLGRAGARDLAALALLLKLGARVSEAANIRLEHFRIERAALAVELREAKGDKPRLLPVPDDLAITIGRYLRLDDRLAEGALLVELVRAGASGPLFRPERNRRSKAGRDKCLSPDAVWRIVRHYSTLAGTPVDTHTLRHTAATKALERTRDVARVAAMLGHSDPKTTMRYLHRLDGLAESPVHSVRYDG